MQHGALPEDRKEDREEMQNGQKLSAGERDSSKDKPAHSDDGFFNT
jgi:hypothetical protein